MLLPYYVVPVLVCAAVVELILWRWRSTSANTVRYLLVAGGVRAIAYSPAIAAGGHGAAILPFFAATMYTLGEPRISFELLLLNGAFALVCFLIFAGSILIRQQWAKRAKAP